MEVLYLSTRVLYNKTEVVGHRSIDSLPDSFVIQVVSSVNATDLRLVNLNFRLRPLFFLKREEKRKKPKTAWYEENFSIKVKNLLQFNFLSLSDFLFKLFFLTIRFNKYLEYWWIFIYSFSELIIIYIEGNVLNANVAFLNYRSKYLPVRVKRYASISHQCAFVLCWNPKITSPIIIIVV